MRTCKTCGLEKPLDEFHRNGFSKRTGEPLRRWCCRKCNNLKYCPPTGKPNTGRFEKGSTPWNKKTDDGRTSLKSLEWIKKVLKRDNHTCQKCYVMHKKMNAHHIKPWNRYPELRFDLDNGMTLCNSCHSALHGKKKCNLLKNGTSWAKGKRFSAEYRKKLSEAHKGKKLSDEHKEALKGRIPWNKGTKGLFSTGKGRNLSVETRAKMSKSHSGKKLSKETREKMSIAQKKLWNKGKKMIKKALES